MEQKIIDSGFKNALNLVLNIRLERKKIYGDAWKQDPDWAILAEIRQKYLRLEKLMLNKKNNTYESVIDTVIDLCNYSLFLLENKLNTSDKK